MIRKESSWKQRRQKKHALLYVRTPRHKLQIQTVLLRRIRERKHYSVRRLRFEAMKKV